MTLNVVVSEFMAEGAVAELQGKFQLQYDPTLVQDRARLLAALAGADALIVRNRTQVDAELLAHAPKLRVVGRLGVGLDNIDVPACEERAIRVIPATGANALAVAEYVIGCTLMLLRGAYLARDEMDAGDWPRNRLGEGRESAGKTLGLVGFGGIGQLTARLAQGLGLQVLAHDPLIGEDAAVWGDLKVRPCALDELLAQSDAVSLHVPLHEGTRRLIDAARIARMRRGAVLINTSRGGIVDEAALAVSLRAGHLGGAALDVFEQEPLPAGSVLAGVPNLILTPHIAGVTLESNERVSSLIAERVAQALMSL